VGSHTNCTFIEKSPSSFCISQHHEIPVMYGYMGQNAEQSLASHGNKPENNSQFTVIFTVNKRYSQMCC